MDTNIEVSETEVHEETTNDVDFDVLHPQNPLLIRFQNGLKQLLEDKLNSIDEDIRQAEGEIKQIENESKNLSEILHGQKCELRKLEEQLYEHNESVSRLISSKEENKGHLIRLKDTYAKESAACITQEKLNTELRRKLEVQNYILQQLRNYEQTQVSNLLVKQQAVLKNKVDKVAHLREKNKQDYLLMKLENEIFKFELLIRDHKDQLDSTCDELQAVQKKLARQNSDVIDSSQENTRLIKLWKNVVFLISRRDEKYSDLKNDLEKLEVSHKVKIIELNSYKRSAEEEMYKNGVVIANRNQKEQILNQLKKNYGEMLLQKEFLENELADTTSMIECTEKNLRNALEIQVEYNRALSSLEVQLKKMHSKKFELEERILSKLHNEVISNNASSKLNEEICKLRELALQQELVLKELEKDYSTGITALKQQENALTADLESLERKKIEIDQLDKVVSNCKEKLNKLKLQTKQQNNALDQEHKQLCLWQQQPVQGSDLTKRINGVEENIKEITKNIAIEKRSWIRKQNETVLLMEKKSQLVMDLNCIQKHVNVLEQKASRLNQCVAKNEKESVSLDKSVSYMLSRISKLNTDYHHQKQCEASLDSENCLVQNTVLEKLKAAEKDTTLLCSEIGNLIEKKDSLEKELLDNQREDLEWEKKVKLAQDMKEDITREQSENGDIGSMKNEIHRMEIRYAQLKKAQDSLISDLEATVHKRGRIFDKGLIQETKDASRTQETMIRKIQYVSCKNKKLNEKIENFEIEYRNLCSQKCQIVSDIKNYEGRISSLQNVIQGFDEKILEYTFQKQKNLEVLIRKQRFADFFVQIKNGKIKRAYPNELLLEKNFIKYQCLRADLTEILEMLCKDFPALMNQIIRIINILQSDSG